MNNFEKFLLGFAKAMVAVAPSVAPIFIHSNSGVLIFNASEALTGAFVDHFTPTAPVA